MKLKYFFIALVAMVACFSEAFAQQVITVSNAEELKQALKEAGAAPQARQAAQGSRVILPVLSIELNEDYDDASELSINSYLELASEVKLLLNGHVVNGDVTLAAGNLSIVDATGTGAWIGCITVNSGATLAAGSGSIIAGESGVAVINKGTLYTDGGAVIGKITNTGEMPGPVTNNTALVAKAIVAQAALNAAIDGQVIQFASDIEGDLTAVQKPNTKITIDGADKTMNGTITIDGKSAAYATAGVTIKNLNFDATAITKDASINLGVSGNNNTRYTNNVTIENCTFIDNDYSAVVVKSYTGGDKNLTISNCTVTGMHSLLQASGIDGINITDCTVESKNGINLNSSSNVEIANNKINVKGYGVRIGADGGTSGKIELTNNVLKTDNSEGDAVVVLRGTAPAQVDLSMTENVVSGTTHISGTTSSTKISAEANYWDGEENPVVAAGSAPVVVNSYYADETKNDLQRNETGSIYAFVGTDRITGDVTSNAEKSLVIKILDSANNVIGTTSVEKTSHMTGMPKTLTWRINLGADDSDSWAMQWEDGAPTIDNKPAKVQLFVDGVQVSEADVKYTSNGDGKDPVFAAKTDANGKILSFLVSQGYNLDNAATTLVNSVASGDNVVILAAGTYNVPTGKNLTITGKVDGVEFDMSKAVGVHSSMTFNNVTFKYSTNKNYIGLQHAGTMVYNNCTIDGQVFLYGASETFNKCTFNQNSSDAYNVWTYGAKEVAFNNCTFNCAGKSVLVYAESGSIYNNVAVNNCTFNATQAVEGKAAIEMDSSLTGGANVTITNSNASGFGTGNVSGNSLWNNKKGNADGNNNDITVTVDGTTVLEPVYDAKIGETGHRTLQEALAAAESGATIDLLADIEASEFININKSVTINGNDHKVTSNATRVFRVTTSDIDVILKDVNMVSRTVMQYPNDIRGISVDPGLQNVQMTLNNCSVDFTDASACDWAYAVNVSGNGTGHKVTVNGGSYEGANVINVHGANNTIVVKDATLTSLYPNNDQYYGACLWVLQEQGSSVEATGNTFNGSNAIAFNLGTGTTLTESDNTDNTTMCVAKIGDVYYSSVNEAINAAENGATVQLLPHTIDEAIAPWAGDSQHKLEKSITIVGAAGTTLTGGMFLGYNDGTVRDNTITVKGINFEGKGVVVANQKNVVIEGNKFTNIDALVSDKHSNSNCAILVIGTKNDMSIDATIKENEIKDVANAGIYLSQVGAVRVEGNTVTGTKHNALTVSAAATATVDVKNNTFAQWGLGGEGRAMRISGAANTNLNGNVMTYEGTAPEEFVKVTGATNIDASKNYWNGVNPFNSGVYVSDINGDPALQLLSYYTDAAKTNEVTISASVAKIGNTYYASIAAALAAAEDGDVITLNWAEGYAPIAMNGSVYGKNVTITGTATVDWNKGFLFVGRGGEGNATVTFDGANLTSASNSASYGIHVSGREKKTNNKYDGTVVIKNSTIVLDYLINKGAMTLDNSTLTVKNGFSVDGRPASETESGQDATATIALTNGSKVVVNNHNGMGLGYEAIGVMDVDATSTFETTQSFLVTAKGTMNIAGKAVVAGTLTNNGAIVLTNTAATLQSSECGNVTTNVPDYKIAYADGTYKVVAKEYVAVIDESRKFESFAEAIAVVQNGETITFVADVTENVTIVQAPDMAFTIDGAGYKMNGTITIDGKSAAYATAGLTIKKVNFIADGITADACVRLGDGTNATRYTNGVTVDGCTFTGTNKEKVGVKNYTGGCKNVTIINSTATGMHSLAQLKTSTTVTLSNNTVTECKNAISLGSSTGVTISECTINVDGYGVRADGGSNVTVTSSNIKAFIPVVVRNASKDSEITFYGTNSMTHTNSDGFWCVIGDTEYEKTGELPTAATANVSVVLNGDGLDFNGVYGNYGVASIGNTKYFKFADALAAAKAGDVITMLQDITEDMTVSKNVTIDGADKTYTGKMTLTNKADITIKNVNFEGKGYNGYAVETRGAYYVTIEDCTAKNYGYGFVQQASATVLTTVKNVTVSNMNYGVKVDYGTDVVLENVDITAAVAAVLNSNYGEKTVTIKSSKLNILGTWKRNDTTKTNYVFEGDNIVGEFKIDAALDNFKLAVGATVTAPNTITATATEAGYSVDYKNGKYFVKPNIAKIGDTIYGSLAEALAAAKAGDVITMLQDITEDVTVSKDVTIDGADKTYTGKMTLTSNKGTVSIKNVNFDGKGYNGYAVETRGVYYVTIEDCTAKNYGYGFVQLASATVLTTVKNVTVSNTNYGVKVDYGTDVVLENVDITVGVAAVLNSNYGEKTITIKDSKLSILGTWTRNNTIKTNYVFEGENTIETFVIEPTLDNFYLAVDATLTAPNEITMTTDRYYEVKYDEGKYFVEAITVELVDGQMTEFINANNIDVKVLTYKRSNIKSTWTPFYVPFAVPVSALADKFDIAYINDVRRTDSDNNGELDDFSMEIIYIHKAGENSSCDGSNKILKPNYPYFIRSTAGTTEMNITLEETILYAAKENTFDCTTMTEKFEIKGNYKQKSDLDKQFDYVVGGGEWGHLATGYSLNPFRFYMTRSSRFEGEPTSSLAPMKSMKIRVCGEEDENGATIIYDVVEDSLNGNDFIYDLQGRRVSEPKKGGIYIKNGKKILY